jgi:hypothetical protein
MKAEMRRAMLLLSATTMALLALTACSGGSSQEEAKARPYRRTRKSCAPANTTQRSSSPRSHSALERAGQVYHQRRLTSWESHGERRGG